MTKEDNKTDDADDHRCGFEAYQQAEEDHAATDGPDDLENDEIIKGVGCKAKGDDGAFDDHQPDTSFDEEEALFFWSTTHTCQAGGDAAEEYEGRSAKMGDKACKEQNGCGDRQVCRCGMTFVKGIPDMVDGHDQHDCATYYIDGFDAVFCWCFWI